MEAYWWWSLILLVQIIMQTYPCNEHPLTPHFYIGKLVYRGVHYFLIFALKHWLWVLVRTASVSKQTDQWGGSNVYPRSMFWAKIRKNITFFHLKIIIFTTVNCCSKLHGDVRVMLMMVIDTTCSNVSVLSFRPMTAPFKRFTLSTLKVFAKAIDNFRKCDQWQYLVKVEF